MDYAAAGPGPDFLYSMFEYRKISMDLAAVIRETMLQRSRPPSPFSVLELSDFGSGPYKYISGSCCHAAEIAEIQTGSGSISMAQGGQSEVLSNRTGPHDPGKILQISLYLFEKAAGMAMASIELQKKYFYKRSRNGPPCTDHQESLMGPVTASRNY